MFIVDMNHTVIHAAHLIIMGPLLLAIGLGYLTQYPAIVAGLGVIIIAYHSFRLYKRYMTGGPMWINLIHILIVGPALVTEGAMSDPPRWVREIILMLGFAAIGWHGYYLITGEH